MAQIFDEALVCVAQDVIVLGAVLGKIELRAGEDVDKVRQSLHHNAYSIVPVLEDYGAARHKIDA